MRTPLDLLEEFRQNAELEADRRKAAGDVAMHMYWTGKGDAYTVAREILLGYAAAVRENGATS